MTTSFQIVQVRYEAGNPVEDEWPVLYAIDGQAVDYFYQRGPEALFEHGDAPDADYFVRELDESYIATGRTIDLPVEPDVDQIIADGERAVDEAFYGER